MEVKNKKILITGGAGFLGRGLIERWYDNNEITIFSRDEAKHYYLKKKFKNLQCVIGDVADRESLIKVANGHQIGIFAASLKQIEAVDQNIDVSIATIVAGSRNSREAAEKNKFESACFISTDKSRSATTLYGAMKFIATESFIIKGDKQSKTKLSSVIYGNVLNSTGSVIPLIWDSIKEGYPLELFSTEMTRFIIELDEAINLIEYALLYDGFNIIPNLKSFRVLDLFEIYREEFGFKFKLGKPRISEKIHEVLFSEEESPRIAAEDGIFKMHYSNVYSNVLPFNRFSSEKVVIQKSELKLLLEKHLYFKP